MGGKAISECKVRPPASQQHQAQQTPALLISSQAVCGGNACSSTLGGSTHVLGYSVTVTKHVMATINSDLASVI